MGDLRHVPLFLRFSDFHERPLPFKLIFSHNGERENLAWSEACKLSLLLVSVQLCQVEGYCFRQCGASEPWKCAAWVCWIRGK